jgi:hypothetical protein
MTKVLSSLCDHKSCIYRLGLTTKYKRESCDLSKNEFTYKTKFSSDYKYLSHYTIK